MAVNIKPGFYLCRVKDWGFRKRDSGSVSVTMLLATEGQWGSEQINGEAVEDYFAIPAADIATLYADTYVVCKNKKTGKLGPSASAVKRVVDAVAWDCTPEFFDTKPGEDVQIVVRVDNEPYEGKLESKVQWIYPVGYKPGAGELKDKTSTADIAKEFGSAFRALKPKPAAKPAPKAAPADAGEPLAKGEDIFP